MEQTQASTCLYCQLLLQRYQHQRGHWINCNYQVTWFIKDTTGSIQSTLSKTKPNRIYESIASYIAIFSHSSKQNILSLWTFFNVDVTYRIPKIPGEQRRHRGFWSIHATAWASKMRQQKDWTGKNCLYNIKVIVPCQRISPNPYILFYEITDNIIPVHRLFLNSRYGERSTSTYPVSLGANVNKLSTSKVIF